MAMTPVPRRTKWHHVNDAKISLMTDDPEGGTATYAAPIDVPGIKTLGVGGTVSTQQLRGDNQLLDSETLLTAITVDFAYAKLSLDVLSIVLGGIITDSGVEGAETTNFRLLGVNAPTYWQLEAQTTGVDTVGGDGHLIFPKCKLSGFPDIGLAEEDYRTFSGSAVCIPRLSDNAWFDIDLNRIAVPIA
jgi:hypothetical protein